jgi:hypothetical protein
MNRQQQRVGRGHNEQYIQMHNGVNYQIGSPNYSTTTTTRLNDLTNILQVILFCLFILNFDSIQYFFYNYVFFYLFFCSKDTNRNLKDIDEEISTNKNYRVSFE